METEIWKDIPGYEGYYMASNLGGIYSVRNKKRLSTNHKVTYQRVILSVNGRQKSCAVHRLVAMAFLPNPNNLPEVHHLDHNHHNNRVDNLEWISKDDNQIEYSKSDLCKQFRKENQLWFMRKKDSDILEYEVLTHTGNARHIETGEIVPLWKLREQGYTITCRFKCYYERGN